MTTTPAFYRVSHNSSYTRGFTWAATIVPRSEVIRRVCPEQGVAVSYPSGEFDVVVEGGNSYPDVLGCGQYPFLIVSEPVVDAWRDAGVSSFTSYLVQVDDVHSRSPKLLRAIPPRYYRIEIDGRCEIDMAASGLEILRYAPECHYIVTEPRQANGFRLLDGSWDGSPLFRDQFRYPRESFCTQAIKDIAQAKRFTNFRFEPLAGPFGVAAGG
jgi:hypothetical protein